MLVAAAFDFSDFMQQVVSGLASGGIYALLALALVIIHRSTGVINFAQGEMATLSAYIAWTLIVNHGWSYWPAFVVTLAPSFAGGLRIPRAVIPPVGRGRSARRGQAGKLPEEGRLQRQGILGPAAGEAPVGAGGARWRRGGGQGRFGAGHAPGDALAQPLDQGSGPSGRRPSR